MKYKLVLIFGLGLLVILVGGFYFSSQKNQQKQVMETEPKDILAPLANPATNDLIVLESPKEGEKISSPLSITGKARGNWYFEATFPVVLTNWDGLIIAEGYATAHGEWMTEEFVPFTAELVFTKPDYGERGSLILKKSNPSGLPEHDDALEVTIFFE